ncbi:phage tail protein [Acinetobacter modestus]|uniref:phage tail protein n=1 Tax=Acinetobacter modestus TaxID=1776740 RepID=UPI00301709AA
MMKLAELKKHLAEKLPKITQDKTHLFVVKGELHDGYLAYTARILFVDCREDPIKVLIEIRRWLRKNNLLDSAFKDLDLKFESEVIDATTFDLEVSFPLHDKINITETGYNICKPVIWDEQQGFKNG